MWYTLRMTAAGLQSLNQLVAVVQIQYLSISGRVLHAMVIFMQLALSRSSVSVLACCQHGRRPHQNNSMYVLEVLQSLRRF
jgi:hypothetical protein